MPRRKRISLGGYAYHVLNRANGRLRIFCKDDDFRAFEQILAEGIERFAMRLCGYCLMSNHWHLLVWPRNDGDLPPFMRWITQLHAQRFHASHGTVGIGHLYQGRYKSFPIQKDSHYLTILRYIEANPLRAGLVRTAADWPWSSLSARQGSECPFALSPGPVKRPSGWPSLVQQPVEERSLQQIQNCLRRGAPMGDPRWTHAAADKMNLTSTLRPKGRPKKCTGPL